jgi:release factor glutamine methyltransferase
LPYVWKKWKNNTSAETFGLKFEPQKALFTQENGLYLYRRLFEQIAKRKQKPELIIGEFDPRQKVNLQKLTKKYLPQYRLEIKKNLAKLNRIFVLLHY